MIRTLAAVLLLGALCSAQAATIRIVNGTGGWDFTDIYVSNFCSRDWGANRLADSTLTEGGEWRLQVPAGIYNIRLIDEDGDTYTRTGVPVMEAYDWTATLDDLDQVRSAGPVYSG